MAATNLLIARNTQKGNKDRFLHILQDTAFPLCLAEPDFGKNWHTIVDFSIQSDMKFQTLM